MGVAKDIERMFNRLTLSDKHTIVEFLVGDLNHLEWKLKTPVRETLYKRGLHYQKVRHRPRVVYNGKKDYLNRQLYRYFISADIEGQILEPRDSRDNYNPTNWRLGKEMKKPVSVETTPTVIDPEVYDLVEELKRRKIAGEDMWLGVEEMYTKLEIAQAKEILNDEVGKNQT